MLSSDHVLRAVLHLLREGCRWQPLPSYWGRWNTIYRCWRQWVEAGLWTEILGHLARKPKGQLRFVDSTFIKVHQADQSTIGGSKNPTMRLTKGGHNSQLTAAVDQCGHVVGLLHFSRQCAEPTAAKQVLPLLVNTIVFMKDKGFDSEARRHIIKENSSRACIPPRSTRTGHRRRVSGFYR